MLLAGMGAAVEEVARRGQILDALPVRWDFLMEWRWGVRVRQESRMAWLPQDF